MDIDTTVKALPLKRRVKKNTIRNMRNTVGR